MAAVRTPCIGICSTTSLGDKICRGCKRFGFEVINWNAYNEEEKQAVVARIDQLTVQIMAAYFHIYSVDQLQQVLMDLRVFYDASRSPYCWLHNFLQKHAYRIGSLDELGVSLRQGPQDQDLRDLIDRINGELTTLSEAHFERYFQTP